MTALQISENVGITYNQVNEVFKRHKVTSKQNQVFNINWIQEQLLYSGILGDGRLKKNGKYNYYYSECHSLKEKEYCEWKYCAFGELTNDTNMYGKNLNNQHCDAIEFCTKTTPSLIKYAELRKEEIITNLNEIGLVLFILDDGWFNSHSKIGNFYVSGGKLNYEQLHILSQQYKIYGFGDVHVTGKKNLQISIPSSSNRYVYYIATKLIPENTDIIKKKFKYMFETNQVKQSHIAS